MKHIDTDDVEQEKEMESEDIYDDGQREQMLEGEKITSACMECAFMI